MNLSELIKKYCKDNCDSNSVEECRRCLSEKLVMKLYGDGEIDLTLFYVLKKS